MGFSWCIFGMSKAHGRGVAATGQTRSPAKQDGWGKLQRRRDRAEDEPEGFWRVERYVCTRTFCPYRSLRSSSSPLRRCPGPADRTHFKRLYGFGGWCNPAGDGTAAGRAAGAHVAGRPRTRRRVVGRVVPGAHQRGAGHGRCTRLRHRSAAGECGCAPVTDRDRPGRQCAAARCRTRAMGRQAIYSQQRAQLQRSLLRTGR